MADLTPAAAIRAFAFSTGPTTPAPPATPPAAPAAPTAPASPVEPYSPVSSRHAEQWIQIEKENLAKGLITPEEAARRFDALGATPEQRAPDTRTGEQKMLDQQLPAAKESDFLIRYGEPGRPAPPMTPELQQFDTNARAWLSGAEFPRDHGNSLITQIERTVHATKGMTPEQLESYGLVEYDKLKRVYGGEDKLQEKLHSAALMIHDLDLKQPGLKNLLKSKGIGDNALVVGMLARQAKRAVKEEEETPSTPGRSWRS